VYIIDIQGDTGDKTMENYFDFYVIKVSSTRKTDLKKAGIDAADINSVFDGYAQYGRNSYRRYIYTSSVGFQSNVAGGLNEESQAIIAKYHALGLNVDTQYITRD
jgi:hypothetical protein